MEGTSFLRGTHERDAEPDTRFLPSGLTSAVGLTVVGHTDFLQSAPKSRASCGASLERVPARRQRMGSESLSS
jgi:hypothetical protein